MNSSTPIRNGNYGSPARNQATRNRNAIVFAESSFTTPPRNDLRDRRLLSPPALVQNNHRSRRPRLSQSTRNFSEFAFNLDACLAQLNISSGRNIDIDDTFVVNKDDVSLIVKWQILTPLPVQAAVVSPQQYPLTRFPSVSLDVDVWIKLLQTLPCIILHRRLLLSVYLEQ